MDANHTAAWKQRFAFAAVVFALVCTTPAARAGESVQTPAPAPPASQRPPVRAGSADGGLAGAPDAAGVECRAALLAALLLIPPPVDIISQISVAPEPTALVLGLIGSGLAAAGAWYRRRQALRRDLKSDGEKRPVEAAV
jgi:hypothetical protein